MRELENFAAKVNKIEKLGVKLNGVISVGHVTICFEDTVLIVPTRDLIEEGYDPSDDINKSLIRLITRREPKPEKEINKIKPTATYSAEPEIKSEKIGRFKLLSKYGISLIRLEDNKGWAACTGELDIEMGHSGLWIEGKTPEEAFTNCVKEVYSVLSECRKKLSLIDQSVFNLEALHLDV